MNVSIYTTKTCASCKMVKRYLDKEGIQYAEHDIEDDEIKRREAFEISGVVSVPVTLVGEDVVIGWNPSRLAELIKKHS